MSVPTADREFTYLNAGGRYHEVSEAMTTFNNPVNIAGGGNVSIPRTAPHDQRHSRNIKFQGPVT